MKDKKNLSVESLRKIVCECCRSRAVCCKKSDAIISACPVITNYKQGGGISFTMDSWY